jgi:hypothetical protein
LNNEACVAQGNATTKRQTIKICGFDQNLKGKQLLNLLTIISITEPRLACFSATAITFFRKFGKLPLELENPGAGALTLYAIARDASVSMS